MLLKVSQNVHENTCAGVSLVIKLQAWTAALFKKDPGISVSCEFCKNFKNAFFTKHLLATASVFFIAWLNLLSDFFCFLFWFWIISEAATEGVLNEKKFLEILKKFTEKHLCQSLYNFIKSETLAQVFSYQFCKISINTFFTENLWAADFR